MGLDVYLDKISKEIARIKIQFVDFVGFVNKKISKALAKNSIQFSKGNK
jgi:hypothetical protein